MPKTLTPSTVAAQRTETTGHVSADGKALTFGQKIFRIVAVTGAEEDMLSPAIGGKCNPTLVMPRGATVKMLFVNTDDDRECPTLVGLELSVWNGTFPGLMFLD